jgi:phosphoserine phosphatase RsbX
MMRTQARDLVEWGAAKRTMAGESESGDLHVVQPFSGGVLVAVVDGLGHGPEAAVAARAAAHALRRDAGEPVGTIVRRCHADLRKTRGVVLSLASFDARDETMSWLGVGNVEAVLFRTDGSAKEALVLGNGVVGYQLPRLRESILQVSAGDALVLATDGIRQEFARTSPVGRDPNAAAAEIVREFSKGTDDALVLVAHYKGQ